MLPILPIVLGAAASEHRWGPAALAAGLAISFVVIGFFIATIGYSIGLDAASASLSRRDIDDRDWRGSPCRAVRRSWRLPERRSRTGATGTLAAPLRTGLAGQASVGLLLGAVWSPCVGPTLGAASILAAQGRILAKSPQRCWRSASARGLRLRLLAYCRAKRRCAGARALWPGSAPSQGGICGRPHGDRGLCAFGTRQARLQSFARRPFAAMAHRSHNPVLAEPRIPF